VRRDNVASSERCNWMLTLRDARANRNLDQAGWLLVTEIRRPAERSERFVLYKRMAPTNASVH